MCTKRVSAYGVSAGSGSLSCAIRAATSADGASGDGVGCVAASARLVSRAMPEIIEVEPVEGCHAHVMFQTRSIALRPGLQCGRACVARDFYTFAERLEVQLVAISPAIQ